MLSGLVADSPRRPGAPALVARRGAAPTPPAPPAVGAARAAGLPAGRAVGVCGATPTETLLDALAVLAAGAVLLPLDTRATPEDHRAIVERVHATGILGAPLRDAPPLDPRAALVLSTSGSSGRPKDVLLAHEGLRANIAAILDYLPVADHPRTAIVLPLNYSYALVGQALTTLAAGGTVVLLGDLPYPAQQAERMAALGVDGLSSVPASLRLLAAANAPPLAYVASAGGPLSDATRDAMAAAWPDARRFNQYGLTEASPRVTACSDSEAAFHRGSVGRPLRGVEVEAVDGELVVRSPAVMLGYLNDPEATAAALTPRGLRTGDRGHVDADGYVFVDGRVDDLVKIAGERVSLDAVAASVRTLPGVRDAAAVTLPDARTDLRLGALVVLDAGADLRALRRAARALHPARRPTLWAAAETLPTNARAKLDRAAVRRLLEGTR